ncbi:tryptophan--tRNA ligase [Coemansia thaxteri]|uniref:Tryptophan--tRNA ligase, cytoplasmic n=1 Tax=Coemansia thaxteri TaxID=2663907 RepID=A0A9W8EIE7_9FUNG|nr:tryptophan--tRNA ligase [Coemansia thaxteri]KAJ2002660.1 tryptophan--tRNA ligase [Coemansia thaxteri]KAJ2471374.1 tryptophan--tRNA ligase [Coemansia sp. RSA 2322]KAJ2480095.1 tryptophan--tRNA ligase [Coemansia sp. RSA 2320]
MTDLPSVTAAAAEAPVSELQGLAVQEVEQNITPWEVEGAEVNGVKQVIDYNRLMKQFGTVKIDEALLERFKNVTGHEPHLFLRRGIFFSHRDLEAILSRHEQGKPFYLYTGRGPSRGHMHIGHMLPFIFCKWLQDVFDVPLVVQLTDDEKYLYKNDLTVDQVYEYSLNTVREIAAIGFKPEKTFIFSNMGYMGGAFYRNVLKISRCITFSTARSSFGYKESDHIGKIHFPSIQAAPALCSTFPTIFGNRTDVPCLIPCGIDQDPYFRLTRDVTKNLKHPKPSLIHSKFLPALQGDTSKMSSSVDNSAIFMNDTAAMIKKKINSFAFSGGRNTLEEHREFGGNPDVDVPYRYLEHFLDDDQELADLAGGYRKGEITTGQMKVRCIQVLQAYIAAFQEREKAITTADIEAFMNPSYPRSFASLATKQA